MFSKNVVATIALFFTLCYAASAQTDKPSQKPMFLTDSLSASGETLSDVALRQFQNAGLWKQLINPATGKSFTHTTNLPVHQKVLVPLNKIKAAPIGLYAIKVFCNASSITRQNRCVSSFVAKSLAESAINTTPEMHTNSVVLPMATQPATSEVSTQTSGTPTTPQGITEHVPENNPVVTGAIILAALTAFIVIILNAKTHGDMWDPLVGYFERKRYRQQQALATAASTDETQTVNRTPSPVNTYAKNSLESIVAELERVFNALFPNAEQHGNYFKTTVQPNQSTMDVTCAIWGYAPQFKIFQKYCISRLQQSKYDFQITDASTSKESATIRPEHNARVQEIRDTVKLWTFHLQINTEPKVQSIHNDQQASRAINT